MQESKRQRQVARQLQDELTTIFVKEGLNMLDGGMVSISRVSVTPDLLEARIELSLFQVKDNQTALKLFADKTGEIRKQLGNKLRHHLRRIPTLTFSLDDTLDYVFKMEELFKNINSTDKPEDAE
ncbi:MAG: ribosome-binding factor A [Bacteroidetes bacterium 47-18]|nr:MAG: ribosome-binding factor A [Bacteroidetes bacterium 47-18]